MLKTLLPIVMFLFLTACGTASTLVMEPVKNQHRFSGVTISADHHNASVPVGVTKHLESAISKGLYEDNGFAKNNELNLKYKFLQHDTGNQFARWFWGGLGNMGEASLAVMVIYTDATGKELAKTQVQGRIDSGFFGGSYNEALDKVAEDIVQFTVTNFKQ